MCAVWMGEPTAATPRCEDLDVMDPVRLERGHGTPCRRAKTDDNGAKSWPVVTGRADQAQCVQYGAIAGKLVVLVEHVQAERPGGSSGSSPRRRSA